MPEGMIGYDADDIVRKAVAKKAGELNEAV